MAAFEQTFSPYVPLGSRVLSLKKPLMQGTDVAVVQALYNLMLAAMAPTMAGSQVVVNALYDVATDAAVRTVQTHFRLAVDGIVGADTYFVLGQGTGPHTTYGGPAYGSRSLSQGSAGGDVVVAQNRLNLFAPYARLVGGPADGSFGAATASALMAFKSRAVAIGDDGLVPNGVLGFGTYDATWLYAPAGGRSLLAGSGRNGFDVVFVQALLRQLGYYDGALDGIYGRSTLSAVIALQRAQGLEADGNVGPATFYHLGLNNNAGAPSPLGIAWPVVGA